MNKIQRPTAASFLVTEDCNLRCTYCFEKHNAQRMTKDVARRGLEFLAENAIKDGVGEFSAMIFGGEPMLELDIVEEICSYGYQLGKNKGLKFTVSIVTNATIMNDKLYDIIKTWRDKVAMQIQLSVDGKKEAHDMYRKTKNGKGSFDLISKNIPIYKELYKDRPDHLSIHGVVSKHTLPMLYDGYKFFHDEWGFTRIWFIPVIEESWDESDLKIYDEQNGLIYNNILDIVKKQNSVNEVYNYAPLDRCLRPNARPSAPCGAGKHFVTITSNGDLYPCHQIYFNDFEKETYIGNIFTGIVEENRKLYLEYDSSDLTCPSECDHYHCYRCIAVNWVMNGSIFSQPKGIYCQMSKIDQKYQRKLKEELISMGVLNGRDSQSYSNGNNPHNPDCLCDARGSEKSTCDVVIYQDACLCNVDVDKKQQENIKEENIKGEGLAHEGCSEKSCQCKSTEKQEIIEDVLLADEAIMRILKNTLAVNKIILSKNTELQQQINTLESKLDLIIENIE